MIVVLEIDGFNRHKVNFEPPFRCSKQNICLRLKPVIQYMNILKYGTVIEPKTAL